MATKLLAPIKVSEQEQLGFVDILYDGKPFSPPEISLPIWESVVIEQTPEGMWILFPQEYTHKWCGQDIETYDAFGSDDFDTVFNEYVASLEE